MKLRRLLLALLLALLALGLAPPAAYAGGPTSVLVSSPDRQEARAAYYDDAAYAALGSGVGEGRTGPNAPPAGLAAGRGEDVRLTWLIHDVQIWRIDRIHLTSADGMWVETVVDPDGKGSMFDGPAHWHRPADEAALTTALTELGLLGDAGAAPTTGSAPPVEATAPAPVGPVPGVLGAGLAGLVLGVAGTLVGLRLRARTPAGTGPRVTLSG